MRKGYIYAEPGGEIPVVNFLNNSNKKLRNKFRFILEMLLEDKNCICEPYVKHFSLEKYKMLYEIRFKANGEMVRVIFCEVNSNIVLLHAFKKRNKRDTEQALECALKILEKLDSESLYPFENLAEVFFV